MADGLEVDPRIRQKLGALRLGLRVHVLARGSARLLVVLVVAAVATFVVDYGLYLLARQYLTVGQRVMVLALGALALAVVAWRHVLRPLHMRLHAEDLALLVERRFPELGDRLISLLQLARVPDLARTGVSMEMAGNLARQANTQAAALRFGEVILWKRLWKGSAVALGSVVLAAGLGAWRADLAKLWFQRNVLLRDARWPRETQLSLENGSEIRTAWGEPLTLRVRADPKHLVPARVIYHMTFPSVGDVEEVVELAPDGSHTYVKKIEGVTEPFQFYVTGNDDRTAVCKVVLIEGPQLADIQIVMETPAYMRQKPIPVPPGTATLNVPLGSWLSVKGHCTKDLAAAALLLDGVEAAPCQIEKVRVPDAPEPRPRGFAARLHLTAFKPTLALSLSLKDSDGVTNSRALQYSLVMVQDKPPTVQVAAKGVGQTLTRQARIPLEIEAHDDHAVKALVLEWCVTNTGEKPTRVPLGELAAEEPEVKVTTVFDLEPLSAGMGTGKSRFNLRDTLRLVAVAVDNFPEPQGPNEGLSNPPLMLQIVSDEEMLTSLAENQRAQQDQLRQMITVQGEAHEKVLAALSSPFDAMQRLAAESAGLQQQIGDRVGAVQTRLEEVRERMNNNRVGTDADKVRLQYEIIGPIKELNNDLLKKIPGRLLACRELTNAAALKAELGLIAQQQQMAQVRMEAILSAMVKIETAQQVEMEMRKIVEQSEAIKNKIEGERKAAPPKP